MPIPTNSDPVAVSIHPAQDVVQNTQYDKSVSEVLHELGKSIAQLNFDVKLGSEKTAGEFALMRSETKGQFAEVSSGMAAQNMVIGSIDSTGKQTAAEVKEQRTTLISVDSRVSTLETTAKLAAGHVVGAREWGAFIVMSITTIAAVIALFLKH